MKNENINLFFDACRFAASNVIYGLPATNVAFVCRDVAHERIIRDYFLSIWDEIPNWMKPELTVCGPQTLKFSTGAIIRFVIRYEDLKGGTYSDVFAFDEKSRIGCVQHGNDLIYKRGPVSVVVDSDTLVVALAVLRRVGCGMIADKLDKTAKPLILDVKPLVPVVESDESRRGDNCGKWPNCGCPYSGCAYSL